MSDLSEIPEYFDDDDDFYSEDDFEFIIDSEGELKSVAIPPHLIDCPPESVQVILELFGIDDIKELAQRVLH